MKKFLSLVLALIMTMSLVTIGAGATSFPDDASITYKEAVEVMADLGILSGYADGSFKPQGTLTRGAAAKIISYIALGTKNAERLTVSAGELPADVSATSSVAPFIAYCYGMGIVSGYSNGTFGPKNTVSGYAFIKMVLGALGVKGEFTGTGWQLRAAAEAEEIGLLEGIDQDEVSFAVDATRELACQIAFNAMFANVAVEGDGYSVEILAAGLADADMKAALQALQAEPIASRSEVMLTVASVAPTAKLGTHYNVVNYVDREGTLAFQNFGVIKTEGIVIANQYTGATYTEIVPVTFVTEGKVEKLSAIGAVSSAVEYAVETGEAELGQLVSVFTTEPEEEGDPLPVSALSVKSETVKITSSILKNHNFATNEIATKEVEAKFGKKTVAAAQMLQLKKGGTSSDTPNKLYIPAIVNSDADGNNDVWTKGDETSVGANVYAVYNGEVIAATCNVTRTLTQVTEIDDTKDKLTITLAGIGEFDNGYVRKDDDGEDYVSDFVEEYEGIAEEDYAVAIWAGDKVYLEKAQEVTGTPTKVGNSTNGNLNYTVNGTTYSKSSYYTSNLSLPAVTPGLQTEAKFFVYGKYYMAFTTPDGAASNAAYVICVYSIDTKFEEGAKNEYGDAAEGAEDYTSYYAQTVNMAGEIVIMQITKDEYTNFAGRGLYSFTTETKEDDKNTDAYGEPMTATYAKFEGADKIVDGGFAKNEKITADKDADAISLKSKYYYADDVKFIYLNDKTKAELEVTVKAGVQALKKDNIVSYVYSDVEDSSNKIITAVILDAQAIDPIYTGDVIYVGEQLLASGYNPYPVAQYGVYIDPANKKEAISYEHTVYVNGELTTIITNSSTPLEIGEFYMIEAVEGVEGVMKTTKMESADGAKTDLVVENIFKGMLTTEGAELVDMDVSSVKIVDLRDADDLKAANLEAITDAKDLTEGLVIDVMLGEDADGEPYALYIFIPRVQA